MTIREDIVASAAQFLQDPSVATSPVENQIAFLKAKNLTDEEIHASLARAGVGAESGQVQSYAAPPPGAVPGQQPVYYGGYPPYGWNQQPPVVPKRDWRDWFIMATVVGGVGYGLYTLGRRYIYPLIAPPTPERLELDKKSIDEKFDKAFVLVEQLVKDTEALQEAEELRTQKLDSALSELDSVVDQLKSTSKRRDHDAQRLHDDVIGLKDSIPKALDAQKDLTETRLKDITSELKSLKTLVSQRMVGSRQPSIIANSSMNSPRDLAHASNPIPAPATAHANGATNGSVGGEEKGRIYSRPIVQDYMETEGRGSPLSSGMSAATVKIPEWQKTMATKKNSSSDLNKAGGGDGGSTSESSASA